MSSLSGGSRALPWTQLLRFDDYEGGSSYRLREALLGNVGTLIALSAGGWDVARLAAELGVSEEAVNGIAPFEALAKINAGTMHSGPFSLRVVDSRAFPGAPSSPLAGRRNAIGRSLQASQSDRPTSWSGPRIADENAGAAQAVLSDQSDTRKDDFVRMPEDENDEGLDSLDSGDDVQDFIDELATAIPVADGRDQSWHVLFLRAVAGGAVPDGLAQLFAAVVPRPQDLLQVDVEELMDSGLGPFLSTRVVQFCRPSWVGEGFVNSLTEAGVSRALAERIGTLFGGLPVLPYLSDDDLLSLPGVGPRSLPRLRRLVIDSGIETHLRR
jgi:hypothetical protein